MQFFSFFFPSSAPPTHRCCCKSFVCLLHVRFWRAGFASQLLPVSSSSSCSSRTKIAFLRPKSLQSSRLSLSRPNRFIIIDYRPLVHRTLFCIHVPLTCYDEPHGMAATGDGKKRVHDIRSHTNEEMFARIFCASRS